MGLADLHIHTIYSYDGTASIPAVLTRARQIGLDVIAITDHDEIEGALKAVELAPTYGLEVIPGIEITTAEGDLLAFYIQKKVKPGLPLIDTVLRIGELGGMCVVPHPTATGFGMKSLSGLSIVTALRHPDASRVLLGIETYNATVLDQTSNKYAKVLAERAEVAQTGSSDAHVLNAIGLGATEFPGHTAEDFAVAIQNGLTRVRKGRQLSPTQILGSWAANYVGSAFTRLANAT
ncbi:MAG TPA: PHP domain-containing protein [Anaerolineales bacterium]|nr:PHP domain-containing protein [Anaerolineales bacterium]